MQAIASWVDIVRTYRWPATALFWRLKPFVMNVTVAPMAGAVWAWGSSHNCHPGSIFGILLTRRMLTFLSFWAVPWGIIIVTLTIVMRPTVRWSHTRRSISIWLPRCRVDSSSSCTSPAKQVLQTYHQYTCYQMSITWKRLRTHHKLATKMLQLLR